MNDPLDDFTQNQLFDHNDGAGGDEPADYEGIDLSETENDEEQMVERSILGVGDVEEKFVFQVNEQWSEPFPARHIKARLEAGLLPETTLVKRVAPLGETEEPVLITQMPDFKVTERSAMVSRDDVGTAREITGLLKEASDAMAEWSDASAWSSEGSSGLKNVDKLLKTAEMFSKLSVGLGLLGAGLGIIEAITGDDDTSKILNAIKDLDVKLDSLQTLMLAQLEKLKQIIDDNHARTQIRPYLNKLSTIRDVVLHYQEVAQDPSRKEDAIKDRVLEYKRSEVFESVQGIFAQSTGAQQANNIFRTAYQASYGDMKMITDLGSSLHSLCVFGLIADNLIGTLEAKRSNQGNKAEALNTAKNAADLYQPLIDSVLKAWRTESNNCRYNVKANMVRMMETDIMPKLPSSDHGKAAIRIRDTLRGKWFWLDWLAIVYNPIYSLSNHGYKGWGTKSWFRRQISGGQANIIVKYVDELRAPEGRSSSTRYSYRTIDWGKSLAKGYPFWGGDPVYVTAYINAEDKDWEDVRDMFKELSGQHRSPGLIWACRRYQGAYYACNNIARLKWVNGSHFTICIYR
jgi:hypothetical protein